MRDDPPEDHTSRPARRPARKKFAPLTAQGSKARTAPRPAAPAPVHDPAAPQRIAKVIARAGACSRRDAEAWIGAGRVALNGVVLENPAINVTEADAIAIDGAPLAARARTRLFLFHKPRGLVTTERDPEGRQTIFDYLRAHWPDAPRLVSVGRLDINTEGLLLLTNDGGLARMLELPATGWVRRYRVRANGQTDQAALDQLRQGVTVEGVAYAEIEATLDRTQGANCWLTMGLREGKNREVKRVLEHLGLEVNRLIRLSFGPFQLGELAEGALEEVKTRVLRDQIGPALAVAAGVDFSGPAEDPEARTPPRADRDPAGQARASFAPKAGAARRARPERPTSPPGSRRPIEVTPRAQAEARKKPAPGPRKHIAALREAAAETGGRKRTLRSETADRSGRTVPVERLVAIERPGRGEPKDKRRGSREEAQPPGRNARRFQAERKTRDADGARPAREPRRTDAASSWSRTDRAPESRWRASNDGAPPARSANTAGRKEGDAKSRGRERPRGPYDPAKDRSRPNAGRGAGAGPQRPDRRGASGVKSGAGPDGPRGDRSVARAGKPGGPKFAGRGVAPGPKRFEKPSRGANGQSGAPDGPRASRLSARAEKTGGPKFRASGGSAGPGARSVKSRSDPKNAGPPAGFRGKNPGPRGKGKPGGEPRRGPGAGRGRPRPGKS